MDTSRMIGALALLSFSLGAPSVASACACCDGSTERAPLGWSADGRLAIEVRSFAGCERHRFLEIWRPDGTRAECYDLQGDPERAVSCDTSMQDGDDQTARSPAAERFSSAARPLDPALVRARLEPAPAPPESPDAEGRPEEIVTVEVLSPAGWREVLRLPILRGAPEVHDEPALEVRAELPIVVGVWAAPGGDRAAVLIQGHDTAPGIGHFDTTVHWVDLPRLATIGPRERAPDHWSRVATDAFTAEPVSFPSRTRAQRIARGALELLRRGSEAAAMARFVEAAAVDPSNAFVRYHLARGLMRDGQAARATSVLETLREEGCAVCGAVLREARRDPLFASFFGGAP